MNKFDLGYMTILPAVAPLLLYKRFFKNKYKESLPGMLGKDINTADFGKNPIWIHSVSVGETVAAKSLFNPLKDFFPDKDVVVSTVTETGQQKARESFPKAKKTFYYPLDFSWNVNKFLDKINPAMYIFLETEIWPNFLNIAGKRGVPIFLVNGKMSDRSFKKYEKFGFLFRGPLSNVSAFFMQTEHDAEKMAAVLGSNKNIHVTGNIKFDSCPPALSKEEQLSLKKQIHIPENVPVLSVGSTHPGEEKLFIDVFKKMRGKLPESRMILVPRHPERFNEVASLLDTSGFTYARMSKIEEAPANPDIVLIDKMGLLTKIYGISDAAVVAGSFAPIGGHNLLEPAVHSIPVITGPNMFGQKEIMRVMNEENACVSVTESDAADVIINLLSNESKRKELGIKAKRAVDKNRGSARKTVEMIKNIIGDKKI